MEQFQALSITTEDVLIMKNVYIEDRYEAHNIYDDDKAIFYQCFMMILLEVLSRHFIKFYPDFIMFYCNCFMKFNLSSLMILLDFI